MKEFKTDAYFVLYDKEDYPICYFDNLTELLGHINYSGRNLLKEFNKHGNSVNIIINNKIYKLYKFVD